MANRFRECALYDKSTPAIKHAPQATSTFLALLLALTAPPVHAEVGRTPGSFEVTATGAASYSIPIFTPPGPKGVQPAISLVYNSSSGFGYMGKGWGLSGFSSISRCDKTIAQDGTHSPVQLNYTSGYCLDGNRLKLQSGSYGQASSTWATEIADFSRVTTSTADSYAGPTSWTVERADGLTYTYGGTSDSRVLASGTSVVRQWMVSQISDRSGNRIVFTYKTANSTTFGTTHPVKIEWTRTYWGSSTYLYSMDFVYAPNSAASSYSAYVAGTPVYEGELLTNIRISSSGTLRKNYVLTYGDSPTTGAKRLTEVLECADLLASDCLSPTTISYQDGATGYVVGSPLLSLSGAFSAGTGDYDLSGDGIKDVVYRVGGTVYMRAGAKTGVYGLETSTATNSLKIGKLFGSSRDDILAASGGTWYVYSWNGSSFSPTSTGITTAASSSDITLADVNGDGRDDLVYVAGTWMAGHPMYPAFPVPAIMYATRLNTSSGGSLSFASPVATTAALWDLLPPEMPPEGVTYMPQLTVTSFAKGGDVTGDRKVELNAQVEFSVCYYSPPYMLGCTSPSAHKYVLPHGTGTVYSTSMGDVSASSTDFNNDGCADFIYQGSSIALSGCAGLSFGTVLTPGGIYQGALDWNGDGLKDFLVYTGGANLHVRLLTGNGLGALQDSGIPAAACSFFRTDANGDGLEDAGCLLSGSGLVVYGHASSSVPPDLATHFTDGFGVTHNPSYGSLSGSIYTPYSDASFPYRDVVGGRTVVGGVTSADGAGGTYTKTYQYRGAIENLEGFGFSGFDFIDAVDSRTGVKQSRRYQRQWPYSGAMIEEILWQPNGSPLLFNQHTRHSVTLDSTLHNERYFVYTIVSIKQTYEPDVVSSAYTSIEAAQYSYDTSHGNPLSITTTAGDYSNPSTHITTTAYTYGATPGNWCVLPLSETVTHQAVGQPNLTQYQTFTPDYGNCRISAETVEPSISTRRVHTLYGYDLFGNVTWVNVVGRDQAGSDMPVRASTINWGTTGQFPIAEVNALGHQIDRTFHPFFGGLLTEEDPNNITVVTNEYYENFGRLKKTTLADLTSTFYTYSPCAPHGCQNGDPASPTTGVNQMIVIASQRDAGGSEYRSDWTYTDQFDRPIVQRSQALNGGYIRIGRQYDTLGRVDRETAPCDFSSCAAYWVSNTYDLLGRLKQQTRPRSQSDSTPVTTTVFYSGLSQSITDPEGKISSKQFDAKGRLRASTDHNGYGQFFYYDAAGSLVRVSHINPQTAAWEDLFTATYNYGIQSFQLATNDVDLGARSYTYNSLGELVGWSDAKGQTFTQSFDRLSRMIARTDIADSITTNWTWGDGSGGAKNIGRLADVSMSGYAESFAYDGIGRLSTRTITMDQSYVFDYSYNNLGALDTLSYPANPFSARQKIKYGYQYGFLKSVTDWSSGAGTTYWVADTQNSRGQTTQETLGNGVVTSRQFDAVSGLLASIRSGPGGSSSLQNESYLYDKVGNVTQRQETNLGLTENFCYDSLHRLAYAELGSSPSPYCGSPSLTVAYDHMGNITSKDDVGVFNYTTPQAGCYYYSNAQIHAVRNAGGVAYCYDANGNMTKRGDASIAWTSANYPKQISTSTDTTTFLYGPDRQYFQQVYSGAGGNETTYYVGGLLEKVDAGSIDWRHYIVADDQVVAIVSRTSSGTSVRYPLEDQLGSTSVIANSDGSSLARQSFGAFGAPRNGSTWSGAVPPADQATIASISRRGYTGHSMLAELGLIHMNGRIQDAVSGRFLSPDPYVQDPGFSQSFNRFSYVFNNPLTYIDPSGFEGVICRKAGEYRDYAAESERWTLILGDRAWAQQTSLREWEGRRQLAETYQSHVARGGYVPPAMRERFDNWANATLEELPPVMVWGSDMSDLPPIMVSVEECDGARGDADLRFLFELWSPGKKATDGSKVAKGIFSRIFGGDHKPIGLGRGSTANIARGSTLPRNLREQLAVEQAAASPKLGTELPIAMTDRRWLGSEGWVKMQQIIEPGKNSAPINVHYVYNKLTGDIDDLKIILPGRRQ